ncbi:hypothetical protein STEG23_035637 [Scotinomys teguina]
MFGPWLLTLLAVEVSNGLAINCLYYIEELQVCLNHLLILIELCSKFLFLAITLLEYDFFLLFWCFLMYCEVTSIRSPQFIHVKNFDVLLVGFDENIVEILISSG